jgi:hypothetical protein
MGRIWSVLISSWVVFLAACSATGPAPFSSGPSSIEPGALATPVAPLETSLVASGSSIEVYAQLARGMMACWLGASGPLKQSHIYNADAQPAAAGGSAEIVLHERDATLRDQRGVRAFRVQISPDPAGALVAVASLKMGPRHASAMMRDVAVWAKGGSGCELGALFPPPAPPPAAAKPPKTKKTKVKPKR